jgi:hypothetical protein
MVKGYICLVGLQKKGLRVTEKIQANNRELRVTKKGLRVTLLGSDLCLKDRGYLFGVTLIF